MDNINTTLSVGSAAVVFIITTIVIPLVRYLMAAKDKQIDELKKTVDEIKEIKKDAERRSSEVHRQLFDKCQALELSTTRLGGEVAIANGVHARLDKVSDKIDTMNSGFVNMQTVLNMMMKEKRPGTTSAFPTYPSKETKG